MACAPWQVAQRSRPYAARESLQHALRDRQAPLRRDHFADRRGRIKGRRGIALARAFLGKRPSPGVGAGDAFSPGAPSPPPNPSRLRQSQPLRATISVERTKPHCNTANLWSIPAGPKKFQKKASRLWVPVPRARRSRSTKQRTRSRPPPPSMRSRKAAARDLHARRA